MDGEEEPEAIYERLWREALAGFRAGRFELDAGIDNPEDARRGLSLVARPTEPVAGALAALLERLAAAAPEQYLPAPDELHVTVLSIVTCAPGFALDGAGADAWAGLVGRCLAGVPAFDLDFDGLTASASCAMVRGRPADGTLGTIRARLRDGIARSSLPHTLEARYPARTAHATVLRFRRAPEDPDALVGALLAERERAFGRCRVEALELVVNDWYHRRAAVRRVATVPLGRSASRLRRG